MHLFAGAGGSILADLLTGHTPVCAVEIEEYCRAVLLARQRDGILPRFPIWDDVCTFDGLPWRGGVEVIAGGFPCQDISIAGKGAGIEGNRSGLWGEMARIIGEVRPPYVFVENTPALTFRGLGRVIGDLSEMGYGARWGVVGADDAGAPHIRKRIWILAHANREQDDSERRPDKFRRDTMGWEAETSPERQACHHGVGRQGEAYGEMADSASGRLQGQRAEDLPKGRQDEGRQAMLRSGARVAWWDQDPAEGGNEAGGKLDRVAHGMAHRVDRLKAIGNGQVPQVARIAWDILSDLTEAKQPKQPEPEPHRKRDGSETEKRRKRVGSESDAI